MSSTTRAWLACLAVVAALVVVVPALTGDPPRGGASEPASEWAHGARAASDSDDELLAELDRSLAVARSLAARGDVDRAHGAALDRAHGARWRSEPVTLEAFAADALLRGVYFGESTRAAVVNDELVQEGDELAPGLFVAAIGERHVLLELAGAQARLDLTGTELAQRTATHAEEQPK